MECLKNLPNVTWNKEEGRLVRGWLKRSPKEMYVRVGGSALRGQLK